MEKSNVRYERIDHILTISSGKVNDNLFIAPESILVIKFSDYVKSQLHLNIMYLFNRKIGIYKKAFDYMNGDVRFQREALSVLGYFYEDVCNFLHFNKYNVKIEIDVDVEFPSKQYRRVSYENVYKQLQTLCSSEFSSFEESLQVIKQNIIINNIADYLTKKEDISQKIDSYCSIAIIKSYKDSILSWEVKDAANN